MSQFKVRSYRESDYQKLIELYKNGDLYGGQFDENRDSQEKLRKRISADPDAILVCEKDNHILGTLSLIEDGRVAWLFRFAVVENDEQDEIAKALFEKAKEVLIQKGHHQVQVLAPFNSKRFIERYVKLGFTKGSDLTNFWQDI